jgi:hypothetical protein
MNGTAGQQQWQLGRIMIAAQEMSYLFQHTLTVIPHMCATCRRRVLQMNYQNKQMLMGAMVVAGYDSVAGGQVSRGPGHTHTAAAQAAYSRPAQQGQLLFSVCSVRDCHGGNAAGSVSSSLWMSATHLCSVCCRPAAGTCHVAPAPLDAMRSSLCYRQSTAALLGSLTSAHPLAACMSHHTTSTSFFDILVVCHIMSIWHLLVPN